MNLAKMNDGQWTDTRNDLLPEFRQQTKVTPKTLWDGFKELLNVRPQDAKLSVNENGADIECSTSKMALLKFTCNRFCKDPYEQVDSIYNQAIVFAEKLREDMEDYLRQHGVYREDGNADK